jgi:hypothetical protein
MAVQAAVAPLGPTPASALLAKEMTVVMLSKVRTVVAVAAVVQVLLVAIL